jgi:hypothetical protein
MYAIRHVHFIFFYAIICKLITYMRIGLHISRYGMQFSPFLSLRFVGSVSLLSIQTKELILHQLVLMSESVVF